MTTVKNKKAFTDSI